MRNAHQPLRLVQPLAAYSLTQQSLIFSGFSFHWFQPVAMLIFSGGFIAYNFYSAGFFLRFVSAAAIVLLLLQMNPGIQLIILLTVTGLLSWLYLKRNVSFGSFVLSIRKVPFLKTLLLTVIWTLATAVVPLANQISGFELLLEISARFLFLFPVIIASDRIDFEKDKAAGVLSLPVITGEKKSRWITAILLLIYLMFIDFVYLPSQNQQMDSSVEALMLVSVILTGSMCLASLKSKILHRILLDLSVSSLFLMLLIFYALS